MYLILLNLHNTIIRMETNGD